MEENLVKDILTMFGGERWVIQGGQHKVALEEES